MELGTDFWIFLAIGVFAQLVDGALGMAFGVIGTTVLMSTGVAPAQASAMIHIAEIFTTAASGVSHYLNKNVSWTIVKRIALPGVIGGIIGATVLANIDGKTIAPFVNAYLLLVGLIILVRAARLLVPAEPSRRGMPVIGFAGMTHLGLVSGVSASEKGFSLVCFDPDAKRIEALREGRLPVSEPQLDELLADVEELQRQAKARGGGATHGAM